MKKEKNRGSALILVMISAIVLTIMVGALFTLFKSNTATQLWAKERIQARFTAEAGTNLAVNMIMGGADVPQGDAPIQFLPELGDWYDMGDELGWVQVWVDPDEDNDEVSSSNAYEVRCLARVESDNQTDYSYGMASLVLPKNFAVFATFLNQAGGGYYGDGYRFDGPFHSNTEPWVGSLTAGRNNDIWFYSFSTAADHYLYYGGGPLEVAYDPHHKNLYFEPYEKMIMLDPYFTLSADTIPFGSGEVTWQGTRAAALSGGLVLSGLQPDTRMIISGDTLFVKEGDFLPAVVYDLSALSEPVVWIENDGQTVYLKTEDEWPERDHGLNMALTIGAMGDISISGPTFYRNINLTDPDNDIILGLLSVHGSITIASDPDTPGNTNDDWSSPRWHIKTADYDKLELDAVLMVLDGYFECEVTSATWNPSPAIDLEIVGGYIVNEEGLTTWPWDPTYGYWSFVTYDPRLMTMHPPYFPQTGIWDVAYWDERPDMVEGAGIDGIAYDRI